MILRLVVGTLLVGALATTAYAQSGDMRWGSIPDEHVAMNEYPDDPDAQAIILGDVGKVQVAHNATVRFDRHRRIKILSEGAYDLATVSIYTPENRPGQRIRNVRAQTFVPQPDGSLQRVQMDRNAVFTESLEGGTQVTSFTLPALEPGVIIEYRYQVTNENPVFVPNWTFQNSEPTLWSEYELVHPEALSYRMLSLSSVGYTVDEEREVMSGREGLRVTKRMVAENLPAVREEAFMTTPNDFRHRLDVQLDSYQDRNRNYIPVLQTWDQVAEYLRQRSSLSDAMSPSRAARAEAEQLLSGITDPEEQVRHLYDHVRSSYSWNGHYGIVPAASFSRLQSSRRGTSAEVNSVLLTLLRAAGHDAVPVLASTRRNGAVIRLYPVLSHFNLSMVAVPVGDGLVVLDATDPRRPFGLLPPEALNGEVWIVAENPFWAAPATVPSVHQVTIEAELTESGLAGTVRSGHGGYGALNILRALEQQDPGEYLGEVLLDNVAAIGTASVEDQGDAHVVIEGTFEMDRAVQQVGDLTLLAAMPLFGSSESPFVRETRLFPVDFAYPRVFSLQAEIRIPEGMEIDELPRSVTYPLGEQGGFYQRVVEHEDGVVRLSVRRGIHQTIFEPELYTAVKFFFDRVTAAEQDQIVLRAASGSVTEPEATEPAATEPSATESSTTESD